MTDYSWDFVSVLLQYPVFLRGLAATFTLAGASLACGLSFGLVLSVLRGIKHPILYWPATVFIEVLRNLPALIVLMWCYYALPILTHLQFTAFQAAVLTLSLNTAAYSAEIFRAGIQSVPRKQWSAGYSLGLTTYQIIRLVVLPQAVRWVLPAITNQGIQLTKLTALASTIAYGELLYEGMLLSGYLFRPIEVLTVVAGIYFAFLYAGTLVTYLLESRYRSGRKAHPFQLAVNRNS